MYSQEYDSSNTDEKILGELKISKALNARINSLSAVGAQNLMNKLVEQHWIIMVINILQDNFFIKYKKNFKDSTRDVFRLHTRAIAELGNGLQSEFHLSVCDLCMQGIFLNRLAYVCNCGCIYHARCIRKSIFF